jgi:hypothetical protein
MLAAQITHRHATFGLAQDRKDLGFVKSRHLHQILLSHLAEEILYPHPLEIWGITIRSGEYRPVETTLGPLGTGADAQPLPHNPRKQQKIRPQRDRENGFSRASGGGDGTGVEPSFVDAARFARIF